MKNRKSITSGSDESVKFPQLEKNINDQLAKVQGMKADVNYTISSMEKNLEKMTSGNLSKVNIEKTIAKADPYQMKMVTQDVEETLASLKRLQKRITNSEVTTADFKILKDVNLDDEIKRLELVQSHLKTLNP